MVVSPRFKSLKPHHGQLWSSIDLQTLFPSVVQIFSTFEGSIGTTLTMSGSSLRPDYHAEFDFTNIALATKGLFHKPSGIPCGS